jgi:hypothetical protein
MNINRFVLLVLLFSFFISIPGFTEGSSTAFPLAISENGRYFVDSSKVPFFIQADTPWSLFVALTTGEAEQYFENRAHKGFNTITVNLIEHWFNGDSTAYPYSSMNKEGELPFAANLSGNTPDFTRPNEAYFKHVDTLLRRALENGILVMMTPAYMGYAGMQEGWYAEVVANGPGRCREYGRFLGKRYRNFPNIVWIMDGDRNPDSLSIPLEREIVAGIREFDTTHMFTAHCHPGNSSRDQWEGASWLNFNAVYTYNKDAYVHTKCLNNYQRSPVMPVILFETAYEGEHNYTPYQIRAEMYWGWLCSIAGQQFGNNPIWKFATGWQAALDGQASTDEARLKDLVDSRAWYKLVPDVKHEAVVSGTGSDESFVAVARTADGETIIAYIPREGSPVQVDMGMISGKNANAWWYNPRNGVAGFIGKFPARNIMDFQKPDNEDWILVIDNASGGFKDPGK